MQRARRCRGQEKIKFCKKSRAQAMQGTMKWSDWRQERRGGGRNEGNLRFEKQRRNGSWNSSRKEEAEIKRWIKKIKEEQRWQNEAVEKLHVDNVGIPGGSVQWESLPLPLIFEHLPVRQLCQLRCVCKHWKFVVDGHLLLDSKSSSEEYWFIMAKPFEGAWQFTVFSSHSSGKQKEKDWAYFRFLMPGRDDAKLSILLGGEQCTLLRCMRRAGPNPSYPDLVSTGGLMSAIVHKPGSADGFDIIVFNCLTGSVKALPQPLDVERLRILKPRGCTMRMAVSSQGAAQYYIMLEAFSFLEPGYFEVFDSRCGLWKAGCTVTTDSSQLMLQDGDFFFQVWENEWPTVLAFHVAHDAWTRLSLPPNFGPFTFLKYKGKLLVGAHLQPGYESSFYTGFGVWELQFTSSESTTWVEVARTPNHLQPFLPKNIWNGKLMAEGSVFYMTFVESHLQEQSMPPLVYDVAQSSWFSVPMESVSSNFTWFMVHRPIPSMRLPFLDREELEYAPLHDEAQT